MKHLFKVNTKFADMFIHKIDISDTTITYQMRDNLGKAMESLKTEKYIQQGDFIAFLGNEGRSLPVDLFNYIYNILL